MNKNQNIEELVGRYLEGEMNELERINFENQLANNSNFQEEYQFQNDIIEGIKENRKLELKARLDQISIPSSNIYQYIGLKVAALITITTMIGFGAYYTIFDEGSNSNDKSQITLNQGESELDMREIPDMPEPIVEEALSLEDIKVDKRNKADKSNKKDKGATDDATANAKTSDEAIPLPTIVKPDAVDVIANENVDHKDDSFEISNNSLNKVNNIFDNKVEVETISDKKKNFHYQFYNKKLFLYGDFDKTPYEILEYSKGSDKLYYLYYEGKFYELNSNQIKTSPLEEIKEPDLIRELDQLRN